MPLQNTASLMSCPATKPFPIMGRRFEGRPASPTPLYSMSPAATRLAQGAGGGSVGAGGGVGSTAMTRSALGMRPDHDFTGKHAFSLDSSTHATQSDVFRQTPQQASGVVARSPFGYAAQRTVSPKSVPVSIVMLAQHTAAAAAARVIEAAAAVETAQEIMKSRRMLVRSSGWLSGLVLDSW